VDDGAAGLGRGLVVEQEGVVPSGEEGGGRRREGEEEEVESVVPMLASAGIIKKLYTKANNGATQ